MLKADGLAAGKGVVIESELSKAKTLLKLLGGQFGKSSETVIIETLVGVEVRFCYY